MSLAALEKDLKDLKEKCLNAHNSVERCHAAVCRTNSETEERQDAIVAFNWQKNIFKHFQVQFDKKFVQLTAAIFEIKQRVQQWSKDIEDLDFPTATNSQRKRKSLAPKPESSSNCKSSKLSKPNSSNFSSPKNEKLLDNNEKKKVEAEYMDKLVVIEVLENLLSKVGNVQFL